MTLAIFAVAAALSWGSTWALNKLYSFGGHPVREERLNPSPGITPGYDLLRLNSPPAGLYVRADTCVASIAPRQDFGESHDEEATSSATRTGVAPYDSVRLNLG